MAKQQKPKTETASPNATQEPVNTVVNRDATERAPLNYGGHNTTQIGGMEFRRSRSPLDQTDKKTLDIPEHLLNPELDYRWVNDQNGLVDKRRELGYAVVPELKGKMGEQITTRRRVGTAKDGSPIFAQLMATPKEWRKERHKAAEVERKQRIQDIVAGKSDGKEQLGDEFYTKSNTKIT